MTGRSGLIWAGAYTADAEGHGLGINAVRIDPDGRLVDLGTAAETPSPSFIATHPSLPVLYAVNEVQGQVSTFRVTPEGGLLSLAEPLPAGQGACHVAADPHGRFVTVTCWGDGTVLLYDLDTEGRPVIRFEAEAAVDPHGPGSDQPGADPDPYTGMDRQSRAHASLVLDDGRVVTTDLGYDLLRFWTYAPGEGLVPDHTLVLPPDSGPRHLVQHPDGRVFVVTEYSIEVVIAERVAGAAGSPFRLTGSVPATADGVREGDKAAEIALAAAGDRLYVGIRGSDRITTLAVETGLVRPLADVPSGGREPRHHLALDGFLYVAHEHSDEVTTFDLDPATGVPRDVVQRTELGSPTSLVPAAGITATEARPSQ